jgi:RHS repeat-associated protein
VYFFQPSNWYGYGVDHVRVKVSYIIPAGSGGTGTTTTYYPNNLYEVTGTTSTKNIYAGDTLVASIEQDTPAPKIYYSHLDHLGSTNVVTDEIGYMGQLLSYHPFGSPRVEEQYGGMNQKNQFIGQEYDEESQLSYLNARYYDGARGQFLSQDPSFLDIGGPNFEGKI